MSASVVSVDRYNEDSASPLTVNKPAGASVNDVLIAVIVQHAPSGHLTDLTAPNASWTEQGNYNGTNSQGKVFSHIVTGGDPSTWDFPYYVNADTCLFMFDITGADTTPVVVVTSTTTTSLTSSYDSPTLTPSGTDDLLIAIVSDIGNGATFSVTIPAGMTTASTTQVAGGFMAEGGATQQLASGAATGAKTWTSVTPNAIDGGSFSIAVKSGTAAPTQPAGSTIPRLPNWMLLQIIDARQRSFGSGIATPDQPVSPSGVVSNEAVGSPTVTTTVTVSPSGIPSAEALGNPNAITATSITPSGIVSTELLGSPTISATATISPSGIVSNEQVGNNTLLSTYTSVASGITTGEAVGNPSIQVISAINPAGIVSAERLGTPSIATTYTINANGIPSAETVGNATSQTASSVNANGIVSTEQFGSPSIATTYTINANGIPSSEQSGNTQLSRTVGVNGIPSTEQLGSPTFSVVVGINPTGIPSAEQLGSTTVTTTYTINANGIPSAERFGSTGTSTTTQINASGIASSERLGDSAVAAGPVGLQTHGIVSSELFGNTRISIGLIPQSVSVFGIQSTEQFGSPFAGPEMIVDTTAYHHGTVVIRAYVEPIVEAVDGTSSDEVVIANV